MKAIFNDDVKVISVPQYEELTMDTILDFGRAYVVVENALPVIRETRKMPRAYVCNVIYTLVGAPFKDWVLKSCKDRNDRIQNAHDTTIVLDPRIAAAYEASTFVSQTRGTAAHL